MEQVPEMRNDTKNAGVSVEIQAAGKGRAVITATAAGENERRATEIGPLLEEILHTHWEHWGIND